MGSQTVTIGRIVRTIVGESEYPAIVTRVFSEDLINIMAFTDAGITVFTSVPRRGSGSDTGGQSWYWPERS